MEALSNDPMIRHYRALHTALDLPAAPPTPAPESLFGVLFKHGALRSINRVVDIYNHVSLKYRISIGAHDRAALRGTLRLALVSGDERFLPLGGKRTQPVARGEYAYLDGAGEVVCRLECRQAEHTRVTPGTRAAVFIVQGFRASWALSVDTIARELFTLLERYAGAQRTARFGLSQPNGAVTFSDFP